MTGGGSGTTGGGSGMTGGGGGATGGGGGVTGSCAGTLISCSGRCVDGQADTDHCGGCGRVCGAGQVCNRGICELLPMDCTMTNGCAPGFQCDPTTRACRPGCARSLDCPMGATCQSGTCACPASQHACGQICVPTNSVASCGASCQACPSAPANATATCDGTQCGFTCNAGFHRCGDQCVSNSALATCGSSCTACPASPTNGTATCDGTQCGFSCASGFHACGESCVSNNSTSSCGASCSPCNSPSNGSATCNGLTCGITCSTGFHACGSACSDNTSTASCGSACSPCTTPTNGTATCDGTRCGVQCNLGYHPCASGCCAWTTEPVSAVPAFALDLDVSDAGVVRLLEGQFGAVDAGRITLDLRATNGTWTRSVAEVPSSETQFVEVSLAKGSPTVQAAWNFNFPPPSGGSMSTALRYGELGTSWSTRTIAQGSYPQAPNGVSLTQYQGVPRLAYTLSNVLHDVTFSGANFTDVAAPLTSPPSLYEADIAYSPTGELRAVVFDNANSDIRAIVVTGSTWALSAVETASTYNTGSRVAVDGSGLIHMVYRDETRQRLRYASGRGTTWTTQDVENATASFRFDLTVDRAGNPHVCFLNAAPGSLRYGKKSGGTWRVETVTSVVGPFAGCAIALGPNEEVYIGVADGAGVRLAK